MFIQYFKMDISTDTMYHGVDPALSEANASFAEMTKPFFDPSKDESIVEVDESSGKRTHVIKRGVPNLKEYYMAYADWEPEAWTQYFIDNNAVRYHKITDEAGNVLLDWTAFPNLKGRAMKDWILEHTANIPNF